MNEFALPEDVVDVGMWALVLAVAGAEPPASRIEPPEGLDFCLAMLAQLEQDPGAGAAIPVAA